MELVIKTTEDKFFRQYLEVLKSVSPLSKLNKTQLDILSELLRLSYVYEGESRKWEKVFSRESRASIREKLSLSVQSFNNGLSSMRSLGIIVNNSIPEKLCVYPEGDVILTYKFLFLKHGTE